MIAASYWSLLEPAIEMAQKSKLYGADGEYACIPVGIGFIIGAAFVYGTDVLITALGIQSPNVLLAMQSVGTKQRRKIHEKSDEDLDDNNVISGGQINSGKSHYDTTTIDGIGHGIESFLKEKNKHYKFFVGLNNGISLRTSMYTRPSLLIFFNDLIL